MSTRERRGGSLETPLVGGELALGDVLVDTSMLAPTETLAKAELPAQVARALATLGPREQEILRLRFALGGEEPLTLEQIGCAPRAHARAGPTARVPGAHHAPPIEAGCARGPRRGLIVTPSACHSQSEGGFP